MFKRAYSLMISFMINDFKHDEPLVILYDIPIPFKIHSHFFFKRMYAFGINTPPPLHALVRF